MLQILPRTRPRRASVIDHRTRCAALESGSNVVRDRALAERIRIDEHVDRLAVGNEPILLMTAKLSGNREGGGPEAHGAHAYREHLVEPCRPLPFDRLLD